MQQLESVQRQAARLTMIRYRRTSSVGAMLEELNWEPLASCHRTAHLVLFHKIHYGLVAINIPLEAQLWTNSNRKLPGISHSCIIHWLPKEFILLPHSQRLELSSWRYCPYITPWTIQGLCISINCIWGTPPVVVKGSRDPFVRSQRDSSACLNTANHCKSFKITANHHK